MPSHRAAAPLFSARLIVAVLIGAIGLAVLAVLGGGAPTYATAAYGGPGHVAAPARPAPAKHRTVKHRTATAAVHTHTVQAHRVAAPVTRKPAPKVTAEDSAGFDCRTSGNRTCGPGNPQGATAGCYVGGALAVAWTPDMYGRWHNCGGETADDRLQERRLAGQVPQVCSRNAQGGTTCTWKE